MRFFSEYAHNADYLYCFVSIFSMTALTCLLGSLAAVGGKLLWDKYQKLPTFTPYDLVIRINSLTALSTSGWEIVLGQNTRNVGPQLLTLEEGHGMVVSVLGSYNRGKTFLLNQLCDIRLPSGNLIHTEGISITARRNQAKNIIFIDTAGTDTAIAKDELDDKKATETLVRDIALHLCSYIIIVVNRLRATDQSYINQVLTHSENSNCTQNIIIIHNLMDIETRKDIDEVIQKEVIDLFEAKHDTKPIEISRNSANINSFLSTHHHVELRHFILAKDGSDAANIWNRQSIDGIMTILQAATDTRRELNVVNEMISFVNTKLPQLFINNDEQNNNSNGSNQRKFQVQQHATKPYIVLSHRKEMDDLEQDPDQLKLSPKLLYDDAGYFIGISSMINGQWQPLYNLYETNDELYAVIEVAGFEKDEANVQVAEEAIIIEGRRIDFKERLTSPIIHQEKIPTGPFKLEIPLQCKVDSDTVKLERDEGFYKIICAKKKFIVPAFE